jgi:hypothetical protein
MQTQPIVRLPKMTEKEQQLENLLRRAVEITKCRRPSLAKSERKKNIAAA